MKKLLMGCGIIFLILIGGCTGLAIWGYGKAKAGIAEIEPVVGNFVNKWNDKDMDYLIKIARKSGSSIDEDKFKKDTSELMEKIGQIQSRDLQGFHVQTNNSNTFGNVSYSLHGSNGKGTLQLGLQKNTTWEITTFVVNYALGSK